MLKLEFPVSDFNDQSKFAYMESIRYELENSTVDNIVVRNDKVMEFIEI